MPTDKYRINFYIIFFSKIYNNFISFRFKVCIISSTTSPKEDTLTKDGHVEEYNPFEYRSKKNQTT